MKRYRVSNYGRRKSYRRSSHGSISMSLLCGIVGYVIGVKYPDGFYKIQNKLSHVKGFSGVKKFLSSAPSTPSQNRQERDVSIEKNNVEEKKIFVPSKSVSIDKNSFQVRFSPNGGCLDFAKSFIDNAQNYILVQGYSFTSELLAKALVEAHRRGVKVAILLDKSQPTAVGAQIYFVKNAGIPVSIDYVSGIAHNKIMIIDDKIVLTGSFN